MVREPVSEAGGWISKSRGPNQGISQAKPDLIITWNKQRLDK